MGDGVARRVKRGAGRRVSPPIPNHHHPSQSIGELGPHGVTAGSTFLCPLAVSHRLHSPLHCGWWGEGAPSAPPLSERAPTHHNERRMSAAYRILHSNSLCRGVYG